MSVLYKEIYTEFIKAKNSFVLWLIMAGASFMPAFAAFIFITKAKHLVQEAPRNLWSEFAEISWKGVGFMYSSFFTVLLICLIMNVEHRNSMWKLLFTLPVSKGSIFFSKLIMVVCCLALFYLMFIPFWLVCGYLTAMAKPELQLWHHSPEYPILLTNCIHSFIASLGLVGIHFWLSFRIRNMIIPIAISAIGCIVFVAMYQGKASEIIYLPYSYNYLSINPPDFADDHKLGPLRQHEVLSLFYFLFFTIFGYLDFTKKFTVSLIS